METDQAKLLLGNAMGFYVAAKRIVDGGLGKDFPWPPFFANIGYALELSLKAYILQRGGTEEDCRNVGHNLEAAMTEAHKRGVPLPHRDVTELFKAINQYHRDHSFRYMKAVDVLRLPNINQTLTGTIQQLIVVSDQLPELMPN